MMTFFYSHFEFLALMAVTFLGAVLTFLITWFRKSLKEAIKTEIKETFCLKTDLKLFEVRIEAEYLTKKTYFQEIEKIEIALANGLKDIKAEIKGINDKLFKIVAK